MKRKIIWDKKAINYLNKSISYIRKESVQSADRIKFEILQKIRDLPQNPEIHPADKYKQNNDGDYRYFELYHYRISYQIKEQEIVIIRVRHTSQASEDY